MSRQISPLLAVTVSPLVPTATSHRQPRRIRGTGFSGLSSAKGHAHRAKARTPRSKAISTPAESPPVSVLLCSPALPCTRPRAEPETHVGSGLWCALWPGLRTLGRVIYDFVNVAEGLARVTISISDSSRMAQLSHPWIEDIAKTRFSASRASLPVRLGVKSLQRYEGAMRRSTEKRESKGRDCLSRGRQLGKCRHGEEWPGFGALKNARTYALCRKVAVPSCGVDLEGQ